MKPRGRFKHVIYAMSGLVYFPFSEWVSTARFGTALFLWGQAIYGLLTMAAVLAIPVLIICSLFQPLTRERTLRQLMVVIFLILGSAGGIYLGHKTRTSRMDAFAQRSRLLITAINDYDRDHSAPPKTLSDLVPGYLPAVPSTGMRAYPEYHYYNGQYAGKKYANNRWVLLVFTPGISFDTMLYFPNQEYPERGFGGTVKRIADWAYVHE